MDGKAKDKLVKQALWLLRKALEVLERLFGHPPNQLSSAPNLDCLGVASILESEGAREPSTDSGASSIKAGIKVIPSNPQSNHNGTPQLQGAEKSIFCWLLINGSIGVMQVISLQASNGQGTILARKRNAESKIAKIKAAVKESGIVIQKKFKGWFCYEWTLVREEPKQTDFTIDVAHEFALQAQYELDRGNYLKAMNLAITAIKTDRVVQLAHEVFCLTALEIHAADKVDIDRIRVSFRFLANRIEQIDRGRQIAASSLVHADDEKLRQHLHDSEASFAAEHSRVSGTLMRLKERFGAVHVQMSPYDRHVYEAIVMLRTGGSGLDTLENQRLRNTILVHPAVNRVFEIIEKKCQRWNSASRDDMRNRAKEITLALCLDPQMPANIRLICSKTKQTIRDSLQLPRTRGAEARNYKIMEAASDAYYKKHGNSPADDELADLTGLSADYIRKARDWHRINYAAPPDAVDWQERNRKQDFEDEENDGPDDDDDDPLAGELVG